MINVTSASAEPQGAGIVVGIGDCVLVLSCEQ